MVSTGTNMELTTDMKVAMRVKQAKFRLSNQEVADALGIHKVVLERYKANDEPQTVQQSTFNAIANWLAKDY